jgi:hypothetical protein
MHDVSTRMRMFASENLAPIILFRSCLACAEKPRRDFFRQGDTEMQSIGSAFLRRLPSVFQPRGTFVRNLGNAARGPADTDVSRQGEQGSVMFALMR